MLESIYKFERQVLNITDVTKTIFAGAVTSKGLEHVETLCKLWNGVREKLESYAYNPLVKVENIEVEKENLAFIDEHGNILL